MTRNATQAASRETWGSRAREPTTPLAELVGQWMTEKEATDALQLTWQRLEHKLMLKMRSKGMNLIQGMRSKLPEVLEMERLSSRIKTSDRRLAKMAGQVLAAAATSQADALAKIRLGLCLQQPVLSGDVSWLLVQKGFDELTLAAPKPR
ncbi:MAG: hypothetical protein QM773_04820 [Hyphomonadaceae bacterium]